tara:strand:+ start:199 stop:1104 length:906 start_codon:yes stop_codon:yes gene_type:complete
MKKLIFLFITIMISSFSKAQQLPHLTQYMINNYAINPAVSGMYDYYQIKTSIRNQWVGINDAPRTTILSIYGKKNTKVALGGSVFSDVTGPTSRTGGDFSYSYSFSITPVIDLSLALSAGFTQFKIIKSSISVEDQLDPLMLGGDVVRTLPDATFGLNLYTDSWYFGLSIPQLLSSELNLMDDNFARIYDTTSINGKLSSHIYLLAAYKYKLNTNITFEPNLFYKYVNGVKGQLDLGIKTEYKELLWGGLNYNFNNDLSALSALLGFNINEKFNIGYSYGIPSSEYNSGSHEFMLGVKLPE